MVAPSRCLKILLLPCLLLNLSAQQIEDAHTAALQGDDACQGEAEECSLSLRQLRLKTKSLESATSTSEDTLSGNAFADAAESVPCANRQESWNEAELMALSEIASSQTAQTRVEEPDGCYQQGTYYVEENGHPTMEGTQRTKVGDVAACQALCASTAGCAHFSFWKDGGCLLTSQYAVSKQSASATAGPSSCDRTNLAASFTPTGMMRAKGGLDPPTSAMQYKGVAWETMKIAGTKKMHIFAIGDWGGLLGTGSGKMIQYRGGAGSGSHTMARFRGPCTTPNMVACFNGGTCPSVCNYVPEVDRHAQSLVAVQFNKRAATSNPDFVLNVGDNFYWGGVNIKCGYPMHTIHDVTKEQFREIFENTYRGPGIDGKPWLSVLGNHDWGGFQFNKAWDQQIAYTWASDRWIMPAPFFMQRVEYPDLNFTAEFFMLDTNAMDVKPMHADPEHNICGALHNPSGASCSANGGPVDLQDCFKWMWDLWREQQAWLEKKLEQSDADWQVAITHFQCGHQADFYKKMHTVHGLDLLVTGHTHSQNTFYKWNVLGGLTCFITGGGGGITSEGNAGHPQSSQYGFYDLTISKDELEIVNINHNGFVLSSHKISPTLKASEVDAAKAAEVTVG
jgi:hypothetical protein